MERLRHPRQDPAALVFKHGQHCWFCSAFSDAQCPSTSQRVAEDSGLPEADSLSDGEWNLMAPTMSFVVLEDKDTEIFRSATLPRAPSREKNSGLFELLG